MTQKRAEVWHYTYTLWEDFTKTHPDDSRGYYNLGYLYYKNYLIPEDQMPPGETKEKNRQFAMQFFREAVARDFSNKKAHLNLGNCFYRENKFVEALPHFQNAAKADSTYELAYFNLGNVHYMLQDYPSSIQNYLKAIEVKPSYLNAYTQLGATYQNIGDEAKSIEYYQKAARRGSEQAQQILQAKGVEY